MVLLAAAGDIGIALGGEPKKVFTLPGSHSQEGLDLLHENFPAVAGASATVVYQRTTGTDFMSQFGSTIDDSVSYLSQLTGVASVTEPFSNSAVVSPDGTTALANVMYVVPFAELPDNGVDAFNALEVSGVASPASTSTSVPSIL